jgi:hypothetical protein
VLLLDDYSSHGFSHRLAHRVADFLYPPKIRCSRSSGHTGWAFIAYDLANDGNSTPIFNLTTLGRAYYTSGAQVHCHGKGQELWVNVPMTNGTYLQPSVGDLAALVPARLGSS